jgi:hypothetical protein
MNKDAKISHQALHWHFQQLLHTAQQRLDFLEFQLKESHDLEDNAHKSWVEVVVVNIRQHLNEAEQFMKEQ